MKFPLKDVLYSMLGPDLLGPIVAVWNIVGWCFSEVCRGLNHRRYSKSNTSFWSNWSNSRWIRALNVNFSIFCALLYRTSLKIECHQHVNITCPGERSHSQKENVWWFDREITVTQLARYYKKKTIRFENTLHVHRIPISCILEFLLRQFHTQGSHKSMDNEPRDLDLWPWPTNLT